MNETGAQDESFLLPDLSFCNFIYSFLYCFQLLPSASSPKKRKKWTLELPQTPQNPYRPQYIFHLRLEKCLQACRSEENVTENIASLLRSDLLCREISELKWVWDWKPSVHNVLLNSSGTIATRWTRDNFSLFLPVLAFTTSISFGMSMHQKPFTVVLFWTAWRLKIKMMSQHLLTPKCGRKSKTICGIPKLGINPAWCSGPIFLNRTNWLHRPMTWAQKPSYGIFLGYGTSEFCDTNIFKMLS